MQETGLQGTTEATGIDCETEKKGVEEKRYFNPALEERLGGGN